MNLPIHRMSAAQIAAAVKSGACSARQVVDAILAQIERSDPTINAFTHVMHERAKGEANAIDARRASNESLPPLAGVPFAVKNLFDVEGITTLAGSKVRRGEPAAREDAALVARMKAAGAICVGTLNMDEFAYGFTTENSHAGPCRNPHDTGRIAGGSSGGSAAALAAGMVPITLASDTNGSIRVPASLCGVFGFKPTFGRLSRHGSFPFVASLDHLGPMARCVEDLALAYDACQGPDARDSACAQRARQDVLPELGKGVAGLRIARLGGYFDDCAGDLARQAVQSVADALACGETAILADAALARAAAFAITASEGGARHLPGLREHYDDYEPLSRDRFIAGALMPAAWYMKAQAFRSLFREQARQLFERYDILLAPATPVPATEIGADWVEINNKKYPARPSMGLLTQPISFIGLPVVTVPIAQPGGLPIGVQVIAAPWREDLAMRVAAWLERQGLALAPIAQHYA